MSPTTIKMNAGRRATADGSSCCAIGHKAPTVPTKSPGPKRVVLAEFMKHSAPPTMARAVLMMTNFKSGLPANGLSRFLNLCHQLFWGSSGLAWSFSRLAISSAIGLPPRYHPGYTTSTTFLHQFHKKCKLIYYTNDTILGIMLITVGGRPLVFVYLTIALTIVKQRSQLLSNY